MNIFYYDDSVSETSLIDLCKSLERKFGENDLICLPSNTQLLTDATPAQIKEAINLLVDALMIQSSTVDNNFSLNDLHDLQTQMLHPQPVSTSNTTVFTDDNFIPTFENDGVK